MQFLEATVCPLRDDSGSLSKKRGSRTKSWPDGKPARLGDDQKTDRRNACMCIQNHVKQKRQGTEKIVI